MSVRKLTASLLTVLAMLGGVAASNAQEHMPPADPFAFDPDFRWFEPVYDMDLADMKPKKRAATGWFATYDKLNLHATRPELDEPGTLEVGLDNGWGDRYEIGYMLPDVDNGWLFNWTRSGVGEKFAVRRERLNRLNIDDLNGDPDNVGPPFGFIVPAGDGNNLGYNRRFYDIQHIQNMFSYNSYELNKTWRMEPYHYGGILEPMVGLRWIRFNDVNARQDYVSALDLVPYLDYPNAEKLTTFTALTDNEMFGGQLGFRYFKSRQRFTYGGGLLVFFGGNWQSTLSNQFEDITSYDNVGEDADVVFQISKSTPIIYDRNEEFYFGFDVRGEIGYQLTKMITVRAGFQIIDIARGVWRGGDGTFIAAGGKDQDVQMYGGTFGLNLNH
jgi:hypothetical protein